MKKFLKILLVIGGIGILLLPEFSAAADYYGPSDMVGAALQQSTTNIMSQLTKVGFTILFGLSLIKFAIMGYGQVLAGDIEMTVGKYAKAFIWLSFVIWVMTPAATPVRAGLSNGANFIQGTLDYFLGLASTMSGGNGNSFDSGDIMNVGLNSSHQLLMGVAKATTGNVVNAVMAIAMPQVTVFTALMLMVMNTIILLCTAYIALKVFMVKLDAAIVIAISPLSFSLMGLDALKEQGLAPFKNLLTIIYRVVILAAVAASMKTVSDNLATVMDTNAVGGVSDIWTPITAAIFGYLILMYLAHRSDAIAASLSTGQSMFSSGDMASSVAAGVAAGAAVATGGAAAVAGAANGGKSMGDVMKSLTSGSGSVSNASNNGSGGAGKMPEPAPQKPSASLSNSGQDNRAPRPEDFGGKPFSASGSGSFPASSDTTPTPASDSAPAASSGETAGIGGSGSGLEAKLDKFISSQGAPKRPSLGDRLQTVNDHLAKEQTAVHANVNVNAHDQ